MKRSLQFPVSFSVRLRLERYVAFVCKDTSSIFFSKAENAQVNLVLEAETTYRFSLVGKKLGFLLQWPVDHR